MKKAILLVAMVLIVGLALSGCAMFKAAKEPVKGCLDAWKKGDFEKAFSYFVEDTDIPYEEFKVYAEENPIKAFSLNNISLSEGVEGAPSTGEVSGTVTLKGGSKLGCKFYIIEISEDVWKINDLEEFSTDLIPE